MTDYPNKNKHSLFFIVYCVMNLGFWLGNPHSTYTHTKKNIKSLWRFEYRCQDCRHLNGLDIVLLHPGRLTYWTDKSALLVGHRLWFLPAGSLCRAIPGSTRYSMDSAGPIRERQRKQWHLWQTLKLHAFTLHCYVGHRGQPYSVWNGLHKDISAGDEDNWWPFCT